MWGGKRERGEMEREKKREGDGAREQICVMEKHIMEGGIIIIPLPPERREFSGAAASASPFKVHYAWA